MAVTVDIGREWVIANIDLPAPDVSPLRETVPVEAVLFQHPIIANIVTPRVITVNLELHHFSSELEWLFGDGTVVQFEDGSSVTGG